MYEYKIPYRNEQLKNFLATINWQKLENEKSSKHQKIIGELIALKRKYPKRSTIFVDSIIFNIKNIMKIKGSYEKREKTRDHIMTDHAFVRTLELIEGFCISNLRNEAMRIIEATGTYEPVYVNNRVVTIQKHFN